MQARSSAAGQATGKQFKNTTSGMFSTCRIMAIVVGKMYKAARSASSPYVSLLEEVFLIKRVSAWSRNISSRAGRAPEVAFVDSGIAASLLGADARSLIRPGGPGALLEGFRDDDG
jgi:predicted AAA+ superfamily ATPase